VLHTFSHSTFTADCVMLFVKVKSRTWCGWQIVYNLQTIFNLLPNLNVEDLVTGMLVKTNDMHFIIYLSCKP
jgi:hypothetical protein